MAEHGLGGRDKGSLAAAAIGPPAAPVLFAAHTDLCRIRGSGTNKARRARWDGGLDSDPAVPVVCVCIEQPSSHRAAAGGRMAVEAGDASMTAQRLPGCLAAKGVAAAPVAHPRKPLNTTPSGATRARARRTRRASTLAVQQHRGSVCVRSHAPRTVCRAAPSAVAPQCVLATAACSNWAACGPITGRQRNSSSGKPSAEDRLRAKISRSRSQTPALADWRPAAQATLVSDPLIAQDLWAEASVTGRIRRAAEHARRARAALRSPQAEG
ncbi:hypothetical protein BDV96DRAFT_665449 [Lophiotrema nucula]|uniref:Uncharacterized protein n=1 Tax=Lophiotrema nucula TaxID=690887 RepID=A0A6A5YZW8_9PLEO|nr:hypothetical protein BDV96DRAFT_665449 [Lophiotrema nucula]